MVTEIRIQARRSGPGGLCGALMRTMASDLSLREPQVGRRLFVRLEVGTGVMGFSAVTTSQRALGRARLDGAGVPCPTGKWCCLVRSSLRYSRKQRQLSSRT